MCDRYQLGDSKTTKISIIERLVIAIEAEQVPVSENANIDKFTRFQTFAQIAILLRFGQSLCGLVMPLISGLLLEGQWTEEP